LNYSAIEEDDVEIVLVSHPSSSKP